MLIKSILLYFLFVIVVSAISISENESSMRNFSHRDNSSDEDLLIPESFDLRNVNGHNYLSSLRSQDIPNYCGSSWAIATAAALSDRFRYQTNGDWPTHELAAQVLINCDGNNNGCSGGDPYYAYKYIHDNGIPDESCLPITGMEERCSGINICRSCTDNGSCTPVYDYTNYYISSYGRVSSEYDMKNQIYKYGSITCNIHVTHSFENYHHGIFTDKSGSTLYTHTVSVVGWGTEVGIPYWIVRNTWGSYWGEYGFARIQRGYNLLGIESDCSWGQPEIYSNKTTKKTPSKPSSTITIRNFVSCGYPTDWTLNQAVIKSPLPITYVNVSALPTQYDIRSLYGINYATPNKNQHSPQFCNSCWAQATAAALADRLNIVNGGNWPMIELSSQMILNCASGSCQGGDAGDAYRLAYNVGIPDRTCQAYEGKKKSCDKQGICMDCNQDYCWPITSYRKVFVEEYGEVQGVDSMKAEIFARGPITCFMVMTEEFMNYDGGIFIEHDHSYKGGHIVEVTGWGMNKITGQRYWIARNNWGNDWGENGWFRINMGGSNLMIESSCSWGVPSLQDNVK